MNTAEIFQTIRKLQSQYKEIRPRSIQSLSWEITQGLSSRVEHPYIQYWVEYENLAAWEHEQKQVRLLIDGIIKQYDGTVRDEATKKELLNSLAVQIEELKQRLWPEVCKDIENKLLFDTTERYIYKGKIAGVYILFGELGIEYIGQTLNLKQRFYCHEYFQKNHHIVGLIQIADAASRLRMEEFLISTCSPIHNKVHKTQQIYLLKPVPPKKILKHLRYP